jgi:nucleoside-diphosphate-sugar epimerase
LRVAVSGATGVIGQSAVRALVAAGHDVVGLARTQGKAAFLESLGARPVQTSLFDRDGLARMFEGCDAVCNFATRIPVGYAAVRPGAWRENDRLRTEGVRRVVDAARVAGVRRVVQESVSFLYADNGDGWITEQSPVEINGATEPASVGESHVQDYQCRSRHGVVLRFGTIVGDDDLTRWTLRSAGHGRPIGLGRPETWAHVTHTDDLGPAVVAALTAPSGVYNVGAEPVLRADLVQGYADAVGHASAEFVGPLLTKVAGFRVEPLTRSLRVSSEHFTAQTGWTPRRATFDASWFDVAGMESRAVR